MKIYIKHPLLGDGEDIIVPSSESMEIYIIRASYFFSFCPLYCRDGKDVFLGGPVGGG